MQVGGEKVPRWRRPKGTPDKYLLVDLLVAEHIMGFQWFRSSETGSRCLYDPKKDRPDWMQDTAEGTERLVRDIRHVVPPYSSKLHPEMEAKVDALGRRDEYVAGLRGRVGSDSWELITASPMDRCLAALLAMPGLSLLVATVLHEKS